MNRISVKFEPSPLVRKKFRATFYKDDEKIFTSDFGAEGYRDFTLINNPDSKYYLPNKKEREKVKKAYRSRHKKDSINFFLSPGSLSWFILWNKPKLQASINDYLQRFGLNLLE